MRTRGQQLHLITSDIYDRLVPENHFLKKLDRMVDFGFVDELCAKQYKNASGGPGRPAEPPQRLFKLLLLMFLYQVKFERELERRANESLYWRWFCGYQPDEPIASHKTLWLFRKRLGPELFDEIFARIVEKCIASGLVGKKRYHIDATKQDAAATTYSQFEVAVILTRAMIKRLGSMQDVEFGDPGAPPGEMDEEMKELVAQAAMDAAHLKHVKAERVLAKAEGRPPKPPAEELADLKAEPAAEPGSEPPPAEPEAEKAAAENKQSLLANLKEIAKDLWREQPHAKGDKDARIGKTSPTKAFCGYLTTAVVDDLLGIVLSSKTVAGNTDQGKTLLPAWEKAKAIAGASEDVVADRAFDLTEIRQRLKADGAQPYIPMINTHHVGNVLGAKHFKVTKTEDGYAVTCPRDEPMKQIKQRETGLLVFQGTACHGCPLQKKCTTAKNGKRNFELRPELRVLQEEHWALQKTDAYKHALKRRMTVIESRFGHGKTFHNLGKSIYRSLPMQEIHSALSLMVLNLEKIVKYAPQPS